ARLNGRATLHESRNDLQLVNLCIPTRSAIIKQHSPRTRGGELGNLMPLATVQVHHQYLEPWSGKGR
ncbi:hypothetical protein HN011_006275, partial [Eciton burchellii]